MILYTIKIAVVVATLILVNFLIKKDLPLIGAFLLALPFSSFMTILLMYLDKRSSSEIALFTQNVGLYVLPSLAFFFILPVLLNRGMSFVSSVALAMFLNGSIFVVYKLSLQKFGIKI